MKKEKLRMMSPQNVGRHPDYERYVVGIIKKDEFVLREIYKKFLDMTIRFVTSHGGNREDGMDVFQEALIIICKKVEEANFVLNSSFKTYLYAISRFVWLRTLKKKRLKLHTIDKSQLQEVLRDEEDIEAKLMEVRKHNLCQEKFAQLDEACQQVLRLFFEKKSMKEIAEVMGYTAAFSRKKKHLCKEKYIRLIKSDKRLHEFI